MRNGFLYPPCRLLLGSFLQPPHIPRSRSRKLFPLPAFPAIFFFQLLFCVGHAFLTLLLSGLIPAVLSIS